MPREKETQRAKHYAYRRRLASHFDVLQRVCLQCLAADFDRTIAVVAELLSRMEADRLPGGMRAHVAGIEHLAQQNGRYRPDGLDPAVKARGKRSSLRKM